MARRPGPSFRALLFRCGEGAVCEPSRLEDRQLRELVFLSVQKATLGTGGRGPQAREEKQPEAARKLAKQKGRRAGKVQGLHCHGVLAVLGPELCRMKVSRQSHGRKKQGLKLVSRQLGGWKTAQTASFLAGSEKQR